MGNTSSSPDKNSSSSSRNNNSSSHNTNNSNNGDTTAAGLAASKAKQLVEDVQSSLKKSIRNFDESQSASFLDTLCGPVFEQDDMKRNRSYAYSEDLSEEDSRTISDDNSTGIRRRRDNKGRSTESGSVFSQSDYESEATSRNTRQSNTNDSFESDEDDNSYVERKNKEIEKVNPPSKKKGLKQQSGISKPLASSFAKRCYFTKAGIGKTTQHYEGLTLTGNVVLMLAAAMKLKGCPTICDEDLRRVEQTYPNQFSRLPDELLLSSGWRRISKYCHFSNKPVPDGVPFFHSKQRLHPLGGYYFLLAAAVGMIRPIDVEPLTRDTLVLLETDFPAQSDAAPPNLLQDPLEWTLVDKFCFFSGGPINTEEDVFYQADFDGNPIFMLAFLSPSLTPEELYKLSNKDNNTDEPGLKSVGAVEEVESVYDLTERDFDDLKLYHLGPCRALPPYILQPQAWTKVLPPHFLTAKHRALIGAQRWQDIHGTGSMASSGVVSHPSPEYNYDPPATGTPLSPGMVSPGMVLAPPLSPGMASRMASQRMSAPPHSQVSYGSQAPHSQASYGSQGPESGQYPPPPPPPQNNGYGGYYQQQQATPPPPPPRQEEPSPDLEQVETVDSDSFRDESFQREVEEEGAFVDNTLPIDEAIALRQQKKEASPLRGGGPVSPPGYRASDQLLADLDPPEDEQPPSLSRDDIPDDEAYQESRASYYSNRSQTADYYTQDEFASEKQTPDNNGDAYYSREDEYYDSPEQHGSNRADYYQQQQQDAAADGYHHREPYHGEEPTYQHGDPTYRPEYQGQPQYHADPDYHGEPEYGGEVHPDYGGEPHPDYAGEVHPDYGEPHAEYGEPHAEYGDEEHPDYRADEHPDHHGEIESPERYDDRDVAERYRSPERDEYNNTENEPPSRDDQFSPIQSPEMVISPRSETSRASNHSQQSSAMRTAQELLKRNRAKRMEASERKIQHQLPEDEEESVGNELSQSESGSEMTSVISGSSVWTDSSNAGDRSSRRALILQMAKARMKQNKNPSHVEDKTTGPIAEEDSSFARDSSRTDVHNSEIDFAEELD